MTGPIAALTQTVEALRQGLATKPEPLTDRVDALERALEQLEADHEWLAGEVKRMRGKITGGDAKKKTHEDAPGPTIVEGPVPKGSPEYFEQQRRRYGLPRRVG